MKVSLTAGIPPASMTDSQWQLYFEQMKKQTVQSKKKRMSNGKPIIVDGVCVGVTYNHSDTQSCLYCRYINDILNTIRSNERDFCYHIYQVADLLRFEHDRLRTRFLPEYGCIEVWLSF